MRSIMSASIFGIDAEFFVIKLFDSIKCAASTGSALEIKLTSIEVQELAEHVKAVNWIEINEEAKEHDEN